MKKVKYSVGPWAETKLTMTEKDKEWETALKRNKKLKRRRSKESTQSARKARKDDMANHVKTSNKFDILKNVDDDMELTETEDEETTPECSGDEENEPETAIPPPIIVTSEIPNISKVLNQLNSALKKPPLLKIGTGTYTFRPQCIEDHKILCDVFTNVGLEFHSFADKHEKSPKMVVKGLPDLPTEEIISFLQKKGIPIDNCIKMKTRKGSTQSHPFYIIMLKPGSKSGNVYKLRYILNVKVKIDKYKNPSGITQCHRCQGFGHGTTYCNHTPKCVKCGQDHLTKTCTKTKEEKAVCANCQGQHTANYRQCPKYLEHKNKIETRRKQKSKRQTITKPEELKVTQEEFPYLRITRAQAAREQNLNTTNAEAKTTQGKKESPSNLMSDISEELHKLNEQVNLTEFLELLRNLNESLSNCKNKIEKFTVMTQLIIKYGEQTESK